MIQYYGFISGLYGLIMFCTTSELLQFALSPSSTYCQRSASITPNILSLPLLLKLMQLQSCASAI